MRKPVTAKEAIKALPAAHKKIMSEIQEDEASQMELIRFTKAHAEEMRLMFFNCQQLAKALFKLQVLRGVTTEDDAYTKIQALADEILQEQVNKL